MPTQFEVDRKFDDLEYVKKRLTILAEKQPVATKRTYQEFVEIINAAMLVANLTGSDPDLAFPEQNYTGD